MPGYNRFTYGMEFNRLAIPGGVNSTASSAFVSDAQVTTHLNEVFAEVQNDLGYKIDWSNSQSLSSGVSLYTIPYNRIGRNIKAVSLILPNGRIGPQIVQCTELQLQNWGYDLFAPNDTHNSSQSPILWAISDINPGKFWLRPTPRYTAPNGVVVTFNPVLASLRRVYNQATVTAAVTNGSPTVTLSADIGVLRVQIGDEFGVLTGINFDGLPTLNKQPDNWYSIINVTKPAAVTVLTLQSAYAEDTNATANFVASQVSPLESEIAPEGFRFAPVDGALAREFKRSRPAFSAECRARFVEAKNNYILAEDGGFGVEFGVTPEVRTFGGVRLW